MAKTLLTFNCGIPARPQFNYRRNPLSSGIKARSNPRDTGICGTRTVLESVC